MQAVLNNERLYFERKKMQTAAKYKFVAAVRYPTRERDRYFSSTDYISYG